MPVCKELQNRHLFPLLSWVSALKLHQSLPRKMMGSHGSVSQTYRGNKFTCRFSFIDESLWETVTPEWKTLFMLLLTGLTSWIFLQIIQNVGPGEHMLQMLGETSDKCTFYVISWSAFAFLVLVMSKWNMLVKREMLGEVWEDLGRFLSVGTYVPALQHSWRFYKHRVTRGCTCASLVTADKQLICRNSEYSQSGPPAWEQASNFHWHPALFIWALSMWRQMWQNSPWCQ